MDNMVIGGTTPLAGTFTNLRVNGTISLAGSTGTAGYVITSNGASAPTWQVLPATGLGIVDDTTTNATRYVTFTSATSGNITTENVSSTKLQYNPSTGNLTSTVLTSTNDASISGLTVGKGGGSVASNTAVGASALATNTSGSINTAIGYQAGFANTTGEITAVGVQALYANTTGTQNTAVGVGALYPNTTGGYNSALGRDALGANTTGSSNVAIGQRALQSNTTASNNTAVGYQAGYSNTTGTENSFVGRLAGYSTTTGSYNTAFGTEALRSNTTGRNTAIGTNAGYGITTGTFNQCFGDNAGASVTTGSKNSILGCYNGNQGGLDIRTASNYIVLSDGDGVPNAYWDANGTLVQNQTRNGYYAQITYKNYFGNYWYSAALTTTTPDFRIYNQNSAGTYMSWGATSWSGSSDARLKNITGTYTNALADIAQIEPIKFTWKNDETNTPHVGVIAQSVQTVVPEAVSQSQVIEGDETEYLGVRYTELIPLIIASIQELKAEVDSLKQQLGK
jgi:hypothetical protein